MGCSSTLVLNSSLSLYEETSEGEPKDVSMPSIIGLRIIWNANTMISLLVTMGGMLCFSVADFFRSNWFATPLLWVGAVAFILSSFITQFLNGPSELEGFHVFQPFEGGMSFVTLQGFAWMFLGIVIQCVLAIPLDATALGVNGLLTSCGIVGLSSQVVLIASLSHFQREVSYSPPKFEEEQQRPPLSSHMYLCLMLMVWPTIVLVAFYLLQKPYPLLHTGLDISTIVIAAIMMLLLSAPLSHVAGGTMYKNYSVWQPFEGGMAYVVCQAFGWMLYSVSLILGTVYLYNNYKNVEIETVMSLLPLIFLGQFIVWLSVLYYDPKRRKKTADDFSISSATRERLAAAVLSVCSCIMSFLTESCQMKSIPEVYLSPLIICCSFLTLMACGVGHLTGKRMYRTFQIWQPFKGGKNFVLMQVFGWTSVGFWIVVMLVVGLSPRAALNTLGLVSTLGVWGHLNCAFLIYSQQFFEETPVDSQVSISIAITIPSSKKRQVAAAVKQMEHLLQSLDNTPSGTSSLTEKLLATLKQELETSRRQPENVLFFGISAEEAVSVLLLTFSFACFVVADIMRVSTLAEWCALPFAVGCACGLFSIAWTHLLCGPTRNVRGYTLFMPFQGGFPFIIFQALGWTLFGLSVVFLSTCSFVSIREIPLTGVVTAVGINYAASQILIFLSIFIFDPASESDSNPITPADSKKNTPATNYRKIPRSLLDESFHSLPSRSEMEATRNRTCGGFFSILIGFGSLGCFAGADIATLCFGAEFPVLPARICAVVAILISVPLTWWLTISGIRRRNKTQRRQLTPKEGFITLQLLGWALWSFTVLIGVLFCYGVVEQNTTLSAFSGRSLSGTFTGISGITAQLLVLFSLEGSHMDSWSSRTPTLATKTRSLLDIFLSFLNLRRRAWFQVQDGRYIPASVLRQMFWALGIVTLYIIHNLNVESAMVERLLTNIFPYAILGSVISIFSISFASSIKTCVQCSAQLVYEAVGCISSSFFTHAVLPGLRFFLDWPMYYYALWWRQHYLAQDGERILQGVHMERRVRYGAHKNELMDIIWPQGQSLEGKRIKHKGSILYAHGGGFVCCNSEVLLHSMTPLARSGHVVYSIDYPLSPEAKHPEAVISVLKALNWMRKRDGIKEVFLLGDSAGGNLITVAAAFIQNPHLLKKLKAYMPEPMHTLRFPRIKRICSLYGVLDQDSWRPTWMGVVLSYCLQSYKPNLRNKEHSQHRSENRRDVQELVTIGDFDNSSLKTYPEALLICGTEDGLLDSSLRAEKHLRNMGHKVTLRTYPGIHGFLGFPIQWTFGNWKLNATPATEDILTFFSYGERELDGEGRFNCPREDVPSDPSVLAVVAGLTASYGGLLIFAYNGLQLLVDGLS
ncbi:hypothetical protein AAMO2058_000921500 [Amorphochlora amoebiformis]